MTISILATGDEIIHGDTLNTNGHSIAKALSSEGLPLGFHVSCSDKERDLLESILFLAKNSSMIISVGGLGPTSDDRTRFAFASYFGLELVEFPEALSHIEARLNRAGLPFDAGNQQQALFPASSTLLPNPYGTAMGCMFSVQDKLIILLPGPPRECLPMFDNYVLPQLQTTHHSDKQLCLWQLFGVSEGQVAEKLENALSGIDCVTGYRLDMPYLEFKVKCVAELVSRVKQIVDPLVAPYIICSPKQKASQLLRDKLQDMDENLGAVDHSFVPPTFRGLTAESNDLATSQDPADKLRDVGREGYNLNCQQTLVIVDKATGGVLETLIKTPKNKRAVSFDPVNCSHTTSSRAQGGISTTVEQCQNKEIPRCARDDGRVFTYSVENVPLYFEITGLDAYWNSENTKIDNLKIKYKLQHEIGEESHSIPFRGHAGVLSYAAEWLSFRILHLINEVH